MRTKDQELGAESQKPTANDTTPQQIANCHLLIAPNKVVQHHRRVRLHIAPEPEATTRASRAYVEDSPPAKPQLSWTTAKWAFLGAWLPLILASGIAVAPGLMGGNRVSQASWTRPGTLHRRAAFGNPQCGSNAPLLWFPPEIQTGSTSAGVGPFWRDGAT